MWPATAGNNNTSSILGQCLKNCFSQNCSLTTLDFTCVNHQLTNGFGNKYVPWTSTQVSCICTGLCVNTTVVTLDISGCYIDAEACEAVCRMLSQNTTLQHLLLNPVHLEKQEAIAIIDSCIANATLELLSLVQWPPKKKGLLCLTETEKDPFSFSEDQDVLLNIDKLQQQKAKPHLRIYWLVTILYTMEYWYNIAFLQNRRWDEYKGVEGKAFSVYSLKGIFFNF